MTKKSIILIVIIFGIFFSAKSNAYADWGDWNIDHTAMILDEGKRYHNHKFVHRYSIEATCTSSGYSFWTCPCGAEEARNVVEPLGHDVTEWKVVPWSNIYDNAQIKPAFTMMSGYCNRCQKKAWMDCYHKEESKEVRIDPTCREDGRIYTVCPVCGTKLSETVLSCSGHKWSDWVEVSLSTCMEHGVQERICSACGEKEENLLEKTDHLWTEWELDAASSNGETHEERACSYCGEIETRDAIYELGNTPIEMETDERAGHSSDSSGTEGNACLEGSELDSLQGKPVVNVDNPPAAMSTATPASSPSPHESLSSTVEPTSAPTKNDLPEEANIVSGTLADNVSTSDEANAPEALSPIEQASQDLDEIISGTCGNNLTWTLSNKGTLIISGTGEMSDYNISDGLAPWYPSEIEPNVVKKLIINSGVTSIGINAFASCESLESVEIPLTVTDIGKGAFFSCSGLEKVRYEGTENQWERLSKNLRLNAPLLEAQKEFLNHSLDFSGTCGETLFWTLDESGTLTISGTGKMFDYGISVNPDIPVAQDEPWRFFASDIKNIVFEDGITHIGNCAFRGCNIISVSIPQSTISIGEYSFAGCKSLKTVKLISGLNIIESSAFQSCTLLEKIRIPESVQKICSFAFDSCFSLCSVEIEGNATEIDGGAFLDCKSLSSIAFSGNAPIIHDSAFTNVTATAFYPEQNSTWSENVRKNYGGIITWELIKGSASESLPSPSLDPRPSASPDIDGQPSVDAGSSPGTISVAIENNTNGSSTASDKSSPKVSSYTSNTGSLPVSPSSPMKVLSVGVPSTPTNSAELDSGTGKQSYHFLFVLLYSGMVIAAFAVGIFFFCWKSVSFNSCGGTSAKPMRAFIGRTLDDYPRPTKDGYIFQGWYTEACGGTRWNFTNNMVNHSITLYAHWKKK